MYKKILCLAILLLLVPIIMFADFWGIGMFYSYFNHTFGDEFHYESHQAGLSFTYFWGMNFGLLMESSIGYSFSNNTELPMDLPLEALIGMGGIIELSKKTHLVIGGGLHIMEYMFLSMYTIGVGISSKIIFRMNSMLSWDIGCRVAYDFLPITLQMTNDNAPLYGIYLMPTVGFIFSPF
ncbi:MAG: hypothetical protein P8107_01710 [Spirochaetia bacterium]